MPWWTDLFNLVTVFYIGKCSERLLSYGVVEFDVDSLVCFNLAFLIIVFVSILYKLLVVTRIF